MYTYPLAPSKATDASALELITSLKSPTIVARRLSEIIAAQEFLSFFLLSGRYTIEGGAIAYTVDEPIGTSEGPEPIAPGGEYKYVTLSDAQLEMLAVQKAGYQTRITDESVTRQSRKPIDDALLHLKMSALEDIEETNLGVANAAINRSVAAGAAWDNPKQIVKDVLAARARIQGIRLGYFPNTIVLPELQYGDVMAEIIEYLPKEDTSILSGSFPNVLGFDWVTTSYGGFTDPIVVDRNRLGGIGREKIISPEYRALDNDTGLETASFRTVMDATDIHLRFSQVPVITNPAAALRITGTAA